MVEYRNHSFLADRACGCVRLPVCRPTECIVAKWCVGCVLQQKLGLYIGRNRLVTKWTTLIFVWRSYQRHVNYCIYIRRWISRKPLKIKAWFQSTTNGKWPTSRLRGIKWSRDRWCHMSPKSQTCDHNTLRAHSALSRKQLEPGGAIATVLSVNYLFCWSRQYGRLS